MTQKLKKADVWKEGRDQWKKKREKNEGEDIIEQRRTGENRESTTHKKVGTKKNMKGKDSAEKSIVQTREYDKLHKHRQEDVE